MKKVFIIAEAGVNHNGSINIAKKLIDIACECHCDAVKFQTGKAENIISKYASKAQYQKITTGENETQLEMVKKLELSYNGFTELLKYCKKKDILFLSTPFDVDSIEFLASLNLPLFKIPSGEITNLPYLRKINSYKKKVILSTGMSNLDEINDALNVLKDCEVSLLHCTTEYPCPFNEVNLKAIQTMKDKYNLEIGYSDHTEGIEVSIAAVAMGATIIEKHFTLDKALEGPDHKASLNPDELKNLVKAIRNVELAFGDGIKKPAKSEIKNTEIARKSIVAKCDIKKGEILSEKNITTKRPATGLNPMKWDEIIGIAAQKNYKEDEII